MADDEVLIDGKGGRKVTGEEVVDGSNTYRAQHVVVLGGKLEEHKFQAVYVETDLDENSKIIQEVDSTNADFVNLSANTLTVTLKKGTTTVATFTLQAKDSSGDGLLGETFAAFNEIDVSGTTPAFQIIVRE